MHTPLVLEYDLCGLLVLESITLVVDHTVARVLVVKRVYTHSQSCATRVV